MGLFLSLSLGEVKTEEFGDHPDQAADTHAPQVMEPGGEDDEPKPDPGVGQGLRDGRGRDLFTLRAPVPMNRMLGDHRLNRGWVLKIPPVQIHGLWQRGLAMGTMIQGMFLVLIDAGRPLAPRPRMPFAPAPRLVSFLGRRLFLSSFFKELKCYNISSVATNGPFLPLIAGSAVVFGVSGAAVRDPKGLAEDLTIDVGRTNFFGNTGSLALQRPIELYSSPL